MSGIQYNNNVLDQGFTPVLLADTIANRPPAGLLGRIFISTDTHVFYRDYGTSWVMIGGSGGGVTNYPLYLIDNLIQNLQADTTLLTYTTPNDALLRPYRISGWIDLFYRVSGGNDLSLTVNYVNKSDISINAPIFVADTPNQLVPSLATYNLDIIPAPDTDITITTNGFSVFSPGDAFGCIELLSSSTYAIESAPTIPLITTIFNTGVSDFTPLTAILNSVNIVGLTAVTINSGSIASGYSNNELLTGNILQVTVLPGIITIVSLLDAATSVPIPYTIVNNGTNFVTLTFDLTTENITNGILINAT
jgi:hypothetical protein